MSHPRAPWLIQLGVDAAYLAEGSTSGCVRAILVHAFWFNFKTFEIAEATFDRSDPSHQANLFELHQKYGTVVGVEQVAGYLIGSEAQAV